MSVLVHGLLHVLGVDNENGPFYAFWSGAGSDLSYLGIFAALFRRHNCHQRGCWRIGRHSVDGTPWCDKHHENARGGHVDRAAAD